MPRPIVPPTICFRRCPPGQVRVVARSRGVSVPGARKVSRDSTARQLWLPPGKPRAGPRRSGGNYAAADGVADQVGDGARADLVHGGRAVGLHRLDGDTEPPRDLLVAVAFGQQLQHLSPRGERLPSPAAAYLVAPSRRNAPRSVAATCE